MKTNGGKIAPSHIVSQNRLCVAETVPATAAMSMTIPAAPRTGQRNPRENDVPCAEVETLFERSEVPLS